VENWRPLATLLALSSACSLAVPFPEPPPAPTRVEAELTWTVPETARPAAGGAWVHVAVRDGSGAELVRRVLRYAPESTASWPDLEPDMILTFDEIPPGPDRSVTVSLREGRDPDSIACCGGDSIPFDVIPHETTEVRVPLVIISRALVVNESAVSWIWAPVGGSRPETLDNGFVLPAGPYSLIGPTPYRAADARLPADTFRYFGVDLARVEFVDGAGTVLGSTVPLASGDWAWAELNAAPLDRRVWATGVLPDGRRTERTPVSLGWYVATSRPDGSDAATSIAISSGPDLGAPDGRWAMRGEWARLGTPGRLSDPAMAYDEARGRVVLFGGIGDSQLPTGITWEWDGTQWNNVGVGPPPRGGAAMAYDRARGETILFGGALDPDTWAWDGTEWTEVGDPDEGPPARSNPAMAYDGARDRVVLHGGFSPDGTIMGDTWEWDGTQWSDLGVGPPARASAAMAYDHARRQVVLFGGWNGAPLDDTWAWDGTEWAEVGADRAAPPARAAHAMEYDRARERVLLFAGTDLTQGLSDTWAWDGTRWTEVDAGDEHGAPRFRHAMAYDRARDRMVSYGGVGPGATASSTWEWDGTQWTRRGTGVPSPPGTLQEMVYDHARDRLVIFGGVDFSASELPETWARKSGGWTELGLGGSTPAGRIHHAMAYDGARDRVVLFGGSTNRGRTFADTWEWDGSSWVELDQLDESPRPRSEHAMVYDPNRSHVVLFGGQDWLLGELADTWSWDGEDWIRREPAGRIPPARRAHAMAYDEANDRVVLFGGHASGAKLSDTWSWDGTRWTEVGFEGEVPPARDHHAMAYDRPRERVVLFGGRDSSNSSRFDTWEWDGDRWTQIQPDDRVVPPSRSHHAMAYDRALGRVVVFRGLDPRNPVGAPLTDTWAWDGTRWTELDSGVPSPSARDAHAMAYDRAGDRVVLFGGDDIDGVDQSDTWSWDGTRWTEIAAGSAPRPPRLRHATAYDDPLGGVVLFGGLGLDGSTHIELSDTWLWDGVRWTELDPAGAPPPPRAHPAMARDVARGGRVLLFGGIRDGTLHSDTWRWEDGGWASVGGSSPPARHEHAMASDASRGRVVLFGGSGGVSMELSDTWEWDGDDWVEIQPDGPSPPARERHAMAYDVARGRTVLFGGQQGVTELSDTWEWDGSRWTEIAVGGASPSPRDYHAMAYDVARSRVVLFGGDLDGTTDYDDTWGLARTLAVRWDVSSPIPEEDLMATEVDAYCASASGGSRVSLLRAGDWVEVGRTATPIEEGGPLPLAEARLSGARAKDFSSSTGVSALCTSTSEEAVAVDYLEMRFRYALP